MDHADTLVHLRTMALQAGAQMLEALDDGHDRQVEHKGRVDLVTRVDHEVQQWLVAEIARLFPGEPVVGEEGGQDSRTGGHEPVWYVDPIDGTTNYVHGHPFYCVSIARSDADGSAGVVYAPALDELFAAATGGGATLERPLRGVPPVTLRASGCERIEEALLATGFPYSRGATARLNLAITAQALARCRGVRRAGSAALDLCYVAAGRLDGYWEFALKPWDLAAGALILREAGGVVTDLEGSDDVLWSRRLAAAAPGLHAALLAMIERAHAAPDLDVLAPALDAPVPRHGPLPGEDTP
jgi:myo-inositol-1(or 4)-monophosphatase